MVSVGMPTYGQEKFIAEAILGVLSQQCDFEVELIVADDCSPDNTAEIVRNIIETHPNGSWIKYIRHEKNKGAIPNFTWTFCQAKGKYIAACEGDDYWTDPLKLQKQVDFLEKNPEYAIVFHKVKEVDVYGTPVQDALNSPDMEKTYDINYLSTGNFIRTPSVVFKKNFNKFPDWIDLSPIGDYPLHLLNASFGLIKYFPDKMAAYRVGSGIWSTQNTIEQITNTMFALKFLLIHFKDNQEVFDNLFIQYTNFQAMLSKPFEEKRLLESMIKDDNYLARTIRFRSLAKILKIRIFNLLRKKM